MPQSRNDDAHDRNSDVGARLIEDEEVEALALSEVHAGGHLLTCVETAELRAEARSDARIAAGRQERMISQAQWRRAIKARFLSAPAAHQTDRQELVELGQRAQQCDPGV